MARPSPSVSDRPMARRPNHPKSGCGYTPSGSCEGATDSGEDRGNTYRRRPRRAKVAWLPPRTPSSSSRVSAMDRCVRVWRTHERARGRDELPSFFSGKCNRLVLHQKLQNSGSLVDKKCEIGLKKTRHVRSNLPEARKSVSVLARKHRVQRRRRVYGANFHRSVRRAANARVRVIGRVVRA